MNKSNQKQKRKHKRKSEPELVTTTIPLGKRRYVKRGTAKVVEIEHGGGKKSGWEVVGDCGHGSAFETIAEFETKEEAEHEAGYINGTL